MLAHISLPTMSLSQPSAVIVAFPTEGRKRFFGRASPVANLGLPDRAIGPARQSDRACPTTRSGLPDDAFGPARRTLRASPAGASGRPGRAIGQAWTLRRQRPASAGADNGDQIGELRALSLLNAGEFLQTGHQIGRAVAEVLVLAHISLPTTSGLRRPTTSSTHPPL